MPVLNRCCFAAAALWLVAGLLRWWAAPQLEQLPADYLAETSYAATMWSRQTPASVAEEFSIIVRRRDQTLISRAEHSIIQGDAHWSTPAGVVIFETFNLYGVDRHSRQNVAGYGARDRVGQYLFAPHLEKKQYDLWDPYYAGPWVARFDSVTRFHGLEVYIFNTLANGIDETAGYASLADVPEKYGALTYGKGRLWIEPVSGVVVNHEDGGLSYFVEPGTGRRVGGPMNRWSAHYTAQTIQAQLQLATATRRQMRALEVWLPFAFAVAGLVCIAAGFHLSRAVT